MSKRKRGDPIPFVLGLPAQTAVDMRTRKGRKAKTLKKEIITTGPTREDNTVVGQLHLGDSGESLSGGCPKDVDEKLLIPGQGSLIQGVGDVRVEKVIDDSALPDENEGSVVVNNATEKVIEGCFSKHTGSVTNSEKIVLHPERADLNDVSLEAGESKILPEEKSLHDKCENITPEQPLGTLVSDSSKNSRNDISQGDGDMLSPGRSLVTSSRKKLLVLDLNGLIADIIRYIPERHTPDKVIAMKAVFKRPFYEDFLQFCFATFNVGVWSSRARSNVHSVVDFLLGDAKQNLLFCWDQSHCTQTGFYTVENRQKPLLAKKLKKLWEKYEPDLPWELGDYNETNTLLLDDSPYKALFNPQHTAIFPPTYSYTDKDDNSLGPGGALRLYLEALAGAEDVQRFVKERPFGQRPITERNASWRFYQKVLETGLITPEKVHSRYSIKEPERRQEMTDGQVYLDSSKKTLESCTEPPEQKARRVLLDTDRPDQRSGVERREELEQEMQTGKPDGNQLGIKNSKGDCDSGNKALDLPVEFCERGGNGFRSRNILHGPHHKRREVASEQGIQQEPEQKMQTGKHDGNQVEIKSSKGDCDSGDKALDLPVGFHERKANASPSRKILHDSDRPRQKRREFKSEQGIQEEHEQEILTGKPDGNQLEIKSSEGDFDSGNKALALPVELRERRANGSPSRQILHDSDGPRQKRREVESEQEIQEEHEQEMRTGKPDGNQLGIKSSKGDCDSGNKALDLPVEFHEQKSNGSPSRKILHDSDGPRQKRREVESEQGMQEEHEQEMQTGKPDGNQLEIKSSKGDFDSGNKALDLPFRERRANGSPSRQILHDSNSPRRKRREVESEPGIQNGEPDRLQHGIQSGKGDIAPTKDLCAESIEGKASGSPRWNMLQDSGSPHERRGFKRKEEGDQKNRAWQGIRSGKGDLGSAYKPLHSHPESSERRASGSPRRRMLHNSDRLQQRRGFARREESEQQGQALQGGKWAFDCANKNVDSRAESREKRPMFCDTNRPQWRWGVDRRGEHEPGIQSGKGDLGYNDNGMNSRAKSRERRASGSPRRHALQDTDQPPWKTGVERREGQHAGNFIRSDDAGNANRQDYGRKTQRWGGDWNQSYRDTNRHPVSEYPMAGGDSYEYSSYDIRSSGWSIDRASVGGKGRGLDWSSRGRGSEWNNMGRGSEWNNMGRGSEWNNMGRGSEWNNMGRGSEWNNRGRGSEWNNRGRGSEWNNRGRGLDWNNRASQESEKWPVPYDQKGSHHSGGFTSYYSQRAAEKSRTVLGAGGRGDWRQRPYQPIDQRPVSLDNRIGGFSYNNRYSTPSFHWQAYR